MIHRAVSWDDQFNSHNAVCLLKKWKSLPFTLFSWMHPLVINPLFVIFTPARSAVGTHQISTGPTLARVNQGCWNVMPRQFILRPCPWEGAKQCDPFSIFGNPLPHWQQPLHERHEGNPARTSALLPIYGGQRDNGGFLWSFSYW